MIKFFAIFFAILFCFNPMVAIIPDKPKIVSPEVAFEKLKPPKKGDYL
jgi:hypothetical protein